MSSLGRQFSHSLRQLTSNGVVLLALSSVLPLNIIFLSHACKMDYTAHVHELDLSQVTLADWPLCGCLLSIFFITTFLNVFSMKVYVPIKTI